MKPAEYAPQMHWIRVAAKRLGISADEYADALNRGEKFCGGCRRMRARNSDNFGCDARLRDGLRSQCLECDRARLKKYYRRNRVRVRANQIQYQREHRATLYAYNAAWSRRRNAKLRSEMLAAYGGRCACCGESQPIFLDLDHKNNNGAEHRRQMGNNTRVMLELRAQNWPKDQFQVLCCNCNQGKARNGGVCPHERDRSL